MTNQTGFPRRSRPSALLLALGAAGAFAAACGSGSSSGTSTTPAAAGGGGTAASTSAPAGQAASLTTATTSLGPVLVGPDGRTVYLFEKDVGTTSNCAGACANVWPPVTTSGMPSAAGGTQGKLLGTTPRTDGTAQVTYAGHPLYYFAGDRAPGDIRGEGLKDFGAGWYVLMPNGQKIDKD